jgi:hypothetical protein
LAATSWLAIGWTPLVLWIAEAFPASSAVHFTDG